MIVAGSVDSIGSIAEFCVFDFGGCFVFFVGGEEVVGFFLRPRRLGFVGGGELFWSPLMEAFGGFRFGDFVR